MCDNFDDDGIDLEDAAFWGGFAWTQVEGEKEEQDPGDPSPEDTLETDLEEEVDQKNSPLLYAQTFRKRC